MSMITFIIVVFITTFTILGFVSSRGNYAHFLRTKHIGETVIDENSNGTFRNKRSITQNGTECPRPKVGTCECQCLLSISCKISCVGLNVMPEKLPSNTIHL